MSCVVWKIVPSAADMRKLVARSRHYYGCTQSGIGLEAFFFWRSPVHAPDLRRLTHALLSVAACLFARGDVLSAQPAPDWGKAPNVKLDATSARVTASDSADVVAVVTAYHKALATGDSVAALALLAPDATILESGGVESRDEYRSHHLPGDIAFARAIQSERGAIRVVVQGDVAWATSTSTTQGEFRGRAVNSAGAELMVLSRTTAGWKIRAIHWSSRTRRPPSQ
jgi:ketosteroid isomerase-like protein